MAPIKELIILLGTCYIICLKATPLGQSSVQDKTYPQWKDIVSPKMETRAGMILAIGMHIKINCQHETV